MIHQKLAADDAHWCILRMAGPRTLKVVEALNAAGLDAWTPTRRALKRRHRSTKEKVEFLAPITPTFAFVRAHHLDTLRAAMALPLSPFPAFSIYQWAGRIPAVSDGDITGFRLEEEAEVERFQIELAEYQVEHEKDQRGRLRLAYEAERLKHQRGALQRQMPAGSQVSIGTDSFAGMVGTVISSNHREAWVDVGGKFPLRIDTWLLAEKPVGMIPA
jgi:hypothetical protein